MEASHNYEICKSYIDAIKSKYDAMVDDNNQGIYNDAHDPIIIFDPVNDLKSITTKAPEVSETESEKYIQKVRNRQNGSIVL